MSKYRIEMNVPAQMALCAQTPNKVRKVDADVELDKDGDEV
jgi:hypothetical protein